MCNTIIATASLKFQQHISVDTTTRHDGSFVVHAWLLVPHTASSEIHTISLEINPQLRIAC